MVKATPSALTPTLGRLFVWFQLLSDSIQHFGLSHTAGDTMHTKVAPSIAQASSLNDYRD